jgi:hypothetical protein
MSYYGNMALNMCTWSIMSEMAVEPLLLQAITALFTTIHNITQQKTQQYTTKHNIFENFLHGPDVFSTT